MLSRTMGYERYFGVLRVVRRRDRRVIFPFDGAPELGPFQSKDEAINAAREYGEKLIADDISTPEP